MFGMANKAVEDMICALHGETVWEQIKSKAGVDVEIFMINAEHPEEITYELVQAASEVLHLPPEKVLEAVGEHWMLHTSHEVFGGLMRAAGHSLAEHLDDLANFHSRASMIFPGLQPPCFRCSDVTENSLKLHSLSHRRELTPFLVGMIQGLGKMRQTPVTVRPAESKDEGAHHEVFDLSWTPLAAA